MGLLFEQNFGSATKLALWKIEESESFFLAKVPLQKQITHPHKRLQHLAGRFLLQYSFPDFPYEDILIAQTRKPFLANEQYHFSISHCTDYAAALVSSVCRVGIDVEEVRKTVLQVGSKFLNINEDSWVKNQQNPLQAATLIWCAKEAVYKWWGRGEVDFKEMIRVNSFDIKPAGSMQASFLKEKSDIDLQIQYKIITDTLCMAWVFTEADHLFV